MEKEKASGRQNLYKNKGKDTDVSRHCHSKVFQPVSMKDLK
jgi:hypothetical protein